MEVHKLNIETREQTMIDRKTVLKLTLLDLCDALNNNLIEVVITYAEDLLNTPQFKKEVTA